MKKTSFKTTIFLIIISFVCACKNEVRKIEPTPRKIDPILNKIFKEEFLNFKTNDLVKSKALEKFTVKMDSVAKANGLNDIPLTVFEIQKNPHGKGALVQFYADNAVGFQDDLLSDWVCFDLICFMSEDEAMKLVKGNKYFVDGKNIKRLKEPEVSILVNRTYYSWEPEIKEDISTSETYDFNAGIYLCELEKLKSAI